MAREGNRRAVEDYIKAVLDITSRFNGGGNDDHSRQTGVPRNVRRGARANDEGSERVSDRQARFPSASENEDGARARVRFRPRTLPRHESLGGLLRAKRAVG